MKTVQIEALVRRLQEDDEDAFESLYRYFYPRLYASAYKLCRNDADAKDAVQMTFIQVRQSIHTLQQPSFFPLWINRIVTNKCKNLFRYNHDDLFDEEYFRLSNRFVEKKRDNNAISSTHFQSDKEQLWRFISELPVEQRDVLECTYFKQMNNEETAQKLKIPVGTVKSRLFIARKTLKEKVERYEGKEGIALDFQAEAICAAFIFALLQKQLTLPLSSSLLLHLRSQLNPKTMLSTSVGKVSILAACSSVAVGGGVLVYDQVQQRAAAKQLSQEILHETPTSLNMKAMNLEILTYQDAYYLLRGWAYDEAAMNKKSKDQIQEVLPVYQALKIQGGIFYELLSKSGWSTSFEKIAEMLD